MNLNPQVFLIFVFSIDHILSNTQYPISIPLLDDSFFNIFLLIRISTRVTTNLKKTELLNILLIGFLNN